MGWGDEVMAAGEAQALGGKVGIYDNNGNQRYHPAWENNHCIAKIGENHTKKIVNAPNCRPYVKKINHATWEWQPYVPKLASFYFSAEELAFMAKLPLNYIVIEPNLKDKAESINRRWSWERFAEVTNNTDLQFVQLGKTKPKMLPNTKWIKTDNERYMAAALRMARAYIGHEGGMHHTAAAVQTPAVVIFGGFITPKVTGYKNHINFAVDGLGCGRRLKCTHCESAMNEITSNAVINALRGILNG